MNKLAIGERRRRSGWTTLDGSGKPDILATVPPLPEQVTAQLWDEIEMIHVIEHFPLWEARDILLSCWQILKPGGKLVLEQPNIEYAAKVLLGQERKPRGHKDQFDMWPLYGDPSHKDRSYCHCWGYTPKTLTDELLRVGFNPDAISTLRARSHFPVRDFRIEAVR